MVEDRGAWHAAARAGMTPASPRPHSKQGASGQPLPGRQLVLSTKLDEQGELHGEADVAHLDGVTDPPLTSCVALGTLLISLSLSVRVCRVVMVDHPPYRCCEGQLR